MAANPPTIEELLVLVQTLQAQVTALSAAAPAAQAPAAVAAPTGPIVFADTPSTLGVDDIIDFKTKHGNTIFERGCQALDDKALTDGFSMSMTQSVIFVEALQRKCTLMGWNQGTKQITSFVRKQGR
jgi:hypothetical protein